MPNLRTLKVIYYTLISYLFRVFSVIVMASCVLGTLAYILSFFSNKFGQHPPWALLVMAAGAAFSVMFWKISTFVLKGLKEDRMPFD